MTSTSTAPDLVGRELPLARLGAVLGRLRDGNRVVVFVAGEAGIGKTSLIRAAVSDTARQGAQVAWGTCVDVEGAPGYWPWTQALDGLVRDIGVDVARALAGEDAAVLASILPSFGVPSRVETSARDRLVLMDAADRFLQALAAARPLVVVLDDLQWADESSLMLLDFHTRAPRPGPVAIVGGYRHDELPSAARVRLGDLLSRSEHLALTGLDLDAVAQLVEYVAGERVAPETAAGIHRRTGGHPFFVRELTLLALTGSNVDAAVPAAVRDAIERRLARLPTTTVEVLEVLSLLGSALLPDVAATVLARPTVEVEEVAAPAVDASVLARTRAGTVFVHDLWRETVIERLPAHRRTALHQAIGSALEERKARGGEVAASETARHFIAAVSLDGPDRAVRWALAAATADTSALAFVEAAGHLRRLRAALADAAVTIDDGRLVEILLTESDALARGGNTVDARGLLRHASDVADRAADPGRIAGVALAIAGLGARFATRRDDVVRNLDRALALVRGVDDIWEARVAATLARELQNSVPEDRPRAGPLSEHALELGRRAGDNATLRACLLARHDVVWTPGTGAERATIARELISVALADGDEERHAEGLLLLANALLEQGSPAYEAPLETCIAILEGRDQPQHRYTATSRRACLALLRGQLDDAEALIEEAATLGTRIREPDTGNVRMSQGLELVRARNRPEELLAFAVEAVEHWTGAPVHAHAVAAGFCARAGDLDAARHHVATVVDLGSWRADRSYLWSVFVRELAHAAIAVDDGASPPSSSRTSTPCRERAASTAPSSPSPAATPTPPAYWPPHSVNSRPLGPCWPRRPPPTSAWAPPGGWPTSRRKQRSSGPRPARPPRRCSGEARSGSSPSRAGMRRCPIARGWRTSPACWRHREARSTCWISSTRRTGRDRAATSPTGAPSPPTGAASPTSRATSTMPSSTTTWSAVLVPSPNARPFSTKWGGSRAPVAGPAPSPTTRPNGPARRSPAACGTPSASSSRSCQSWRPISDATSSPAPTAATDPS